MRQNREDRYKDNKRGIYNEILYWLKRAASTVNNINNADAYQWRVYAKPQLQAIIGETKTVRVVVENLKDESIEADFEQIVTELEAIEPPTRNVIFGMGTGLVATGESEKLIVRLTAKISNLKNSLH